MDILITHCTNPRASDKRSRLHLRISNGPSAVDMDSALLGSAGSVVSIADWHTNIGVTCAGCFCRLPVVLLCFARQKLGIEPDTIQNLEGRDHFPHLDHQLSSGTRHPTWTT